jgi:catabolite repression HPr-like protein
MQRKKTIIGLQAGLHARPASLFAQEAKKFLSDIYLEKDSKILNGKSVMGLMSLALKKDMENTY